MKICHYDRNQVGIVEGEKVFPIGQALVKAKHLKSGYTMLDVVEALANKPGAMKGVRDAVRVGSPVALASVKLLAPILNPPSFWAAAANYKDHQAEMRVQSGSEDRSKLSKDDLMAEFFLKPTSSIIGPGGTVVLPKISIDVDFECELCAVIGRTARHVTEDQALDYVFGYTICWDFSQRDPWGRGRQNTRNIRKGFDTFAGLGPWIVTRDEIPDPHVLQVRTILNGKEMQNSNTKNLIFNVNKIIAYASQGTTLEPGDLIPTGTPFGVGFSRKPPVFLQDGDMCECEVEKVGKISNKIRQK